jgi:hypothetical protein
MTTKIKRLTLFVIQSVIDILSFSIFIIPGIIVSFTYLIFVNKEKKNKILLGIHEIANNLKEIRECLIGNGYTITLITTKNKFYESKYKYEDSNKIIKLSSSRYSQFLIEPFYLPFIFLKNFYSHSIHFYVWNKSFFPAKLDFLLIKFSKKKLLIMHCGDDVRYRPIQKTIDQKFGLNTWSNSIKSNQLFFTNFYFQKISEITGSVISIRDQSTFQSKSNFYLKVPMVEFIKTPKVLNQNIKILHAPSDPKIKGTIVVNEAIQILKNKNLIFDFIFLTNVPNDVVIKELKNTDILIDQPSTWLGRLGMEACALSCCVIGGNQKIYMGIYDSPVIQFENDAERLAFQIETLIMNKSVLQEKMVMCYEYWKNNYSYESFSIYFKQVLNNCAPTFSPLPNHKEILISAAENSFQKFLIKYFY